MMNELATLVEQKAETLPEASFTNDKESVRVGNMTVRFKGDKPSALALAKKLRKKKKVGTTQRKVPAKKHACIGGPYYGHDLYLTPDQPCTMVFTASGMTGRYVRIDTKGKVFWEYAVKGQYNGDTKTQPSKGARS